MIKIQVYSDDNLIYDNVAPDDLPIIELTVDTELKGGGRAAIELPPTNPYYDSIINYKSIIRIYKDDELLFRGRALYRENDFYKNRTYTCEGELCFLNDSVHRPYLYQDSPANVFQNIITNHNAQVEADKQFVVGTITVTDLNDYVRIESRYAETSMELINKLLNSCGGYIVFTFNNEGQRCINWLKTLPYISSQSIVLGENLIDLNICEENTELATRIIPYGAVIEGSDDKITIESVNDGIDYIQDDDAVALRGIITKAVYWNDVTLPENLLAKAQAYLADIKNIITSLELTAVDLSYIDKTYDQYKIGDTIHVLSAPHNLDDDFLLVSKHEDLLNAAANKISLGKDRYSLTGMDFAADFKNNTDLRQTEQSIKADYTINIANSVEAAKQTLMSLIQQTSDFIMLEVTEQYATNDSVESLIYTHYTVIRQRRIFI